MRLLLDTHALLWSLSAPERLPAGLRKSLEDPANTVYVSAASAWEISIKIDLGKLSFPIAELSAAVRESGFEEFPISIKHAVAVKGLAPHHRDPFDRMIVAQAIDEGLTIVSRDPAIRLYPVLTAWKN